MPEGNFEIHKSHTEPEKSLEKNEEEVKDELVEEIVKLYEQLQKVGRNICEVIPQNRNFNIELQETEGGVNLFLKHKESGEEIDLSAFLPPEHFFKKDEAFFYLRKEKKICFSENEIKFRGFLLALFHEIGHSHQKRDHATTLWDDTKAFGGLLKKWFQYVVIAVRKEREQKGFGKKFMKLVKKIDVDNLLPHWYLDKKAKSDAKFERNAWAYTLRSLRKLEQDGYEVFAGYENSAQIKAYVAYCLYTYDMNLFMKKFISGELKDLRQFAKSPVFWKKGKNMGTIISDKPNENLTKENF
jgi:hypothetical protein